MNRGTLTGSWRGYTAKLDWNITQSQEENFSDLTCDLYLVCNSGYNIYTGKRNHSVFINGIAYEIVQEVEKNYISAQSQKGYIIMQTELVIFL